LQRVALPVRPGLSRPSRLESTWRFSKAMSSPSHSKSQREAGKAHVHPGDLRELLPATAPILPASRPYRGTADGPAIQVSNVLPAVESWSFAANSGLVPRLALAYRNIVPALPSRSPPMPATHTPATEEIPICCWSRVRPYHRLIGNGRAFKRLSVPARRPAWAPTGPPAVRIATLLLPPPRLRH